MKKILFLFVVVALACCTPSSEETPVSTTAVSASVADKAARQSGEDAPVFNPGAGQTISEELALKMVRAYREKYPDMLRGYYFGTEAYKKLLEVPGVVGIRTYHGLDDNGNQVMVLVPIDKNNQRVMSATICEFGQPCPPFCNDEL